MHNMDCSGHESNRQLFVHMGGDILLLHAALTLNQQTSQIKNTQKLYSHYAQSCYGYVCCGKRAVSGIVATPWTIELYYYEHHYEQQVLSRMF